MYTLEQVSAKKKLYNNVLYIVSYNDLQTLFYVTANSAIYDHGMYNIATHPQKSIIAAFVPV